MRTTTPASVASPSSDKAKAAEKIMAKCRKRLRGYFPDDQTCTRCKASPLCIDKSAMRWPYLMRDLDRNLFHDAAYAPLLTDPKGIEFDQVREYGPEAAEPGFFRRFHDSVLSSVNEWLKMNTPPETRARKAVVKLSDASRKTLRAISPEWEKYETRWFDPLHVPPPSMKEGPDEAKSGLFVRIPLWIVHNELAEVTGKEAKVLLYLASICPLDRKSMMYGRCSPDFAQIKKHSGVKSVAEALAGLERKKLITRSLSRGNTGGRLGTTNEIEVLFFRRMKRKSASRAHSGKNP